MSPKPTLPISSPVQPFQPPVTAATVAQNYFQKELDVLHGANGAVTEHDTVVILQDNCYSHRFSRPRTSRASLNTIVERPERMHASILGIATAYVRLGGRYADGSIAPHPDRDISSISRLPFKIHKTNRTLPLTSPAATAIHGVKWMNELAVMCESAERKLALNGKELTRPDSESGKSSGTKADRSKLHEGDLYLCSGSLSALEGALGGVCEAVDAVFKPSGPKRAFVCIRPPGHHCSADYPSGFCWLNNVHVGIGHASIFHGITHAAIIDFDLHHGDGSQSITWEHNARVVSLPKNAPQSKKTAIGYFSIHDINSYPCEMGDEEKVQNASICLENAHGQTVWNVHLQPWKTEAEFWELYEHRYITVLAKARTFLRLHNERLSLSSNNVQPRAAIFLSAGFDASEWESPGMQRHQVNVPTDFYARFTRDVVRLAEEEGTAANGRVISVLEGGYSDRALMSGVLSHMSGLTVTSEPTKPVQTTNGLGYEMRQRLGNVGIGNGNIAENQQTQSGLTDTFDPKWWALSKLEEIENLVNPPVSPVAPKRPRTATQPTYTTATQSYAAKIVSSPQGRRSLSSSGSSFNQSTLSQRPSTPPPPAVDWATAAHQLSKLLIPSDRQTRSCKPEELNAEASRARRDRHSTIGLPTDMPAPEGKRQLRDRGIRVPKYISDEEEGRPGSRSSRRKTMADLPLLNPEVQEIPAVLAVEKTTRQPRRRLSVASSAGSVNGERSFETGFGSSIETISRQKPLIIKKTRAPSNPPVETSKARTTKKPPVPRIPSGFSAASELEAGSAMASTALKTDLAPASKSEDSGARDVDTLSTRMRKMSFKSKASLKQEQELKESRVKPIPRGRPKATTSKLKKIAESTDTRNDNQPLQPDNDPDTNNPTNESSLIHAPFDSSSIPSHPFFVNQAQSSSEQPLTQILQPDTNPQPETSSKSNPLLENHPSLSPKEPYELPIPAFIAPTSSSIPAYNAPTPSSTFSIPPPPTVPTSSFLPSTPKHNLPVFTSTTPIRFAPPTTVSNPYQELRAGEAIEQKIKADEMEKPAYELGASVPILPDPAVQSVSASMDHSTNTNTNTNIDIDNRPNGS